MIRQIALCLCLVTALPAWAGPLTVVTDIAPVHGLVAQVMAGVDAPKRLLPPGASPHGHALRPSDARALQNADLVIWMGPELTPWLAAPVTRLATGATVITLLEVPGTALLPFRDAHEFDHDHGSEDDQAHGHDEIDPHAWLDPANAIVWLGFIAAKMSAADPENAALYRQNASDAQAELQALLRSTTERLEPLADARFYVFHDAFQYFEARFGLSALGALSPGDASRPSAARISAIRDAIARNGAVCVFAEPQFSDGLIAALGAGAGIRTAILDPLGSDLEPGATLYPALINTMADSVETCLK